MSTISGDQAATSSGARSPRVVPPPAVGDPAQVDPLDEPEEVAGGQQRAHQADRGQGAEQRHRQPGGRVPGGQQGQDLAPEAGQPRQAEGGDAGEGEHPGQAGHEGGHAAAQLDDVAGVVALVHGPGQEEQHAGDDAVGDHAEHGGVDPGRGEGGDAQHHEAHVADRGVGDQPLDVPLGQAAQGAVDDGDGAEHAEHRGPGPGGLGQDRQGDADEPVGAHLQQDPGQQDRADGRGLGVGVGQPGVERPHRHLDGEAEGDGGEHDRAEGAAEAGRAQLLQGQDVEGAAGRLGAGAQPQGEEAQQHDHRPDQGVEDELDRGVLAPGPRPRRRS